MRDVSFARLGRVEQAMKMRHEIADMGIINRRESLGLPCLLGRGVIGKEPDDVDAVEIAELGALDVDEFASEDEMKKLFGTVVLHAGNPVGLTARPHRDKPATRAFASLQML